MPWYQRLFVKSNWNYASLRICHICISVSITSYDYSHVTIWKIVFIWIGHRSIIMHSVSVWLIYTIIHFFNRHSIYSFCITSSYKDNHIWQVAQIYNILVIYLLWIFTLAINYFQRWTGKYKYIIRMSLSIFWQIFSPIITIRQTTKIPYIRMVSFKNI